MTVVRRGYTLLAGAALAAILIAPQALALTAQEIVDSVVDELDNVSDYAAYVEVEYDDVSYSDMSYGSLQWKRSSGTWKSKMVMGSPYSGEIRTDGNTGYNIWDKDDVLHYATLSDGDAWVRELFGVDMFNMERILDDGSWTKDASTETVNSVECYRLYNSDYEVWIDTSTVTKVIRVKAYDNDTLEYELDYSSYSDVESTAMLPATIVVKEYDSSEVLQLTVTYTFSSVDINASLSDSVFEIDTP